MKKILFTLILCFTIICNAHAYSIENELTELKANMEIFRKEISEIKETRLDKTYPIGSIYETTEYSSVLEVQNALGGTWEVYASGKTLIGVDENNTNFNVVNKTGGSDTITLSIDNLPGHSHDIPALSGTAKAGTTATTGGNHTHSIPVLSGKTSEAGSHVHNSWTLANQANGTPVTENKNGFSASAYAWITAGTKANGGSFVDQAGSHSHTVTTTASTTGSNGAHTHTITTTANTSGSVGSATPFTNLQPYITVYRYQRIA